METNEKELEVLDKMAIVDALYGSVPQTMTLEEAREERLKELIQK
ncbi:MAG: hypothetical protein Q4D13_05000 [Erysipelotrichaceae bacterium]|nr:hypothetical protein [Erysipelotrichaceae bacterium]